MQNTQKEEFRRCKEMGLTDRNSWQESIQVEPLLHYLGAKITSVSLGLDLAS